ncbi:gpW family head-tail joining protein [Rhodopila sp.]|uniref:gpW family head-tail joining protein n=1 Tax=Rhodopila sp. TaxID=2480087 RepID=UPI003D12E322
MRFNPRTSIFAGMSNPQLQTALANAQQAYLDLSSGAKVVTVAYAQGDGSKSVTYTAASISNIVMLIKELQAQLGIIRRARAPIRFAFR